MNTLLSETLKILHSQPFIFEFAPAASILLVADENGGVCWVHHPAPGDLLHLIRSFLPGKRIQDYYHLTLPDDLRNSTRLEDLVRFYGSGEAASRKRRRYSELATFQSRNILEREMLETDFETLMSYSFIRFIRIHESHFLGIINFNFGDLILKSPDTTLFLIDHSDRIIGLNRNAREHLPPGADPLGRPLKEYVRLGETPPPPARSAPRKGIPLIRHPGVLPPETRFTENIQRSERELVLDGRKQCAALRLPALLELARHDYDIRLSFNPGDGESPFLIFNCGNLHTYGFPDDSRGITLIPLSREFDDRVQGPHLLIKARGEIHDILRLPAISSSERQPRELHIYKQGPVFFLEWCGRPAGSFRLDQILEQWFKATAFPDHQTLAVGVRKGSLLRLSRLSVVRHPLSGTAAPPSPPAAFLLHVPGTRYHVQTRFRPLRGRFPIKRELHLTDLSLLEKLALLSRAKEESDHEVERLRFELSARSGVERLVGVSPIMKGLKERLAALARTDAPILLTGETGTGKSLIAEIVHARSPRSGRPFVKVDCAALPPTLIETELFGHEKGAFTGAVGRRIGKFELAQSGTLFLDEIGELTPALQAKLLSVLEDHVVTRVGGIEPIPLDIRIVAATNRNLESAQASGAFRSDLFYRLSALQFRIPSLREHPEDIALLSRSILERMTDRSGLSLSPAALEKLKAHSWPGNVRELQNVLQEAAAFTRGSLLGPRDLKLPEPETAPSSTPAEKTRRTRYKHTSVETILETLKGCHNNIAWTAENLGISRMTIYKKLKAAGKPLFT